MAIYNLSGNFQPPTVDSGRGLPSSGTSTPSTSTNNTNTKTELSLVTKTEIKVDQPADQQTDKLNTKLTDTNQTKAQSQAAHTQIEEFEKFSQNIDRSLQFKVDQDLGVTIVRVVDKETDELIRQFPPEELINLSKRLKELNDENSGKSGVFLQEKV